MRELSRDVLCVIFKLLEMGDMLNAGAVCYSWRRAFVHLMVFDKPLSARVSSFRNSRKLMTSVVVRELCNKDEKIVFGNKRGMRTHFLSWRCAKRPQLVFVKTLLEGFARIVFGKNDWRLTTQFVFKLQIKNEEGKEISHKHNESIVLSWCANSGSEIVLTPICETRKAWFGKTKISSQLLEPLKWPLLVNLGSKGPSAGFVILQAVLEQVLKPSWIKHISSAC
jgi:hypothetical protein